MRFMSWRRCMCGSLNRHPITCGTKDLFRIGFGRRKYRVTSGRVCDNAIFPCACPVGPLGAAPSVSLCQRIRFVSRLRHPP